MRTGWSYHNSWFNGKVRLDHHIIIEKLIRKSLPKEAQVHHRDGNGKNNVPSNLIVCEDQTYHKLIEKREKAYRLTGHANYERSEYCKNWDNPNEMKYWWRKPRWAGNRSYGAQIIYYHTSCGAEYSKAKNAKIKKLKIEPKG